MYLSWSIIITERMSERIKGLITIAYAFFGKLSTYKYDTVSTMSIPRDTINKTFP
jgi:hypothetical protein